MCSLPLVQDASDGGMILGGGEQLMLTLKRGSAVPTKNLSHCQPSLSEPQIASPPRVDRSLLSLHRIIHLLALLIHLALPPSAAHPCSSRLPLRLGATPADKECFDTLRLAWKGHTVYSWCLSQAFVCGSALPPLPLPLSHALLGEC